MAKRTVKSLNLALQGGGAHGAFTWGALDALLADERIEIEAITATSAGAMNAAVLAHGLSKGGREGARQHLSQFWEKVSRGARLYPLQPTIVDKLLGNTKLEFSPSFVALDFLTRVFSPYQFNLFDLNPLRDILSEMVNFTALRRNKKIKIFVNATHVQTGKIRVFKPQEISLEAVMASACLPFLFKTVEVDGEPYWDGGYSGNPALFPLFYHCTCSDVVLVQINPLYVEEVPTAASDILDRINEISFNSNLMSEMRAIAFVQKLLKENRVSKERYKDMRVHLIESQELMAPLGRSSKLNLDWDFLQHLRDIGAQTASDWLAENYDAIGERSTADVKGLFL